MLKSLCVHGLQSIQTRVVMSALTQSSQLWDVQPSLEKVLPCIALSYSSVISMASWNHE